MYSRKTLPDRLLVELDKMAVELMLVVHKYLSTTLVLCETAVHQALVEAARDFKRANRCK